MKKIYTIGHSSHDNIDFLELLKKYNINCVIDIRSVPFSKYVPHFNKEVIKKYLNVNGIYYLYMAEEFGAVRKDKNLFHPKGYLDFDKVKSRSSFSKGIQRINTGIEKGYKICLMCTEKDPLDCHRSIMIAPELIKQDYSVIHILPNGEFETQQHLEERLLELYSSKLKQLDLFSFNAEPENHKTILEKAYSLRNADIGIKIKDIQ